MTRSGSDQSNTSNHSRVSRRQLEVSQQAQRSIKPKDSEDSERKVKMVRIKSDDGSCYKDKAMIDKAQSPGYRRPQHPKLKCRQCDDHPEGFRGDHELQRHVNRAHSTIRKVWVCVDKTPEGKFLANCKACRTHKRYGAYYNAAAHLRRAHFNPRKRGRKLKGEAEKRGGKGGGNWPPMEDLKADWMHEIDETVTENMTSLSTDRDDAEESEQADNDNDDYSTSDTNVTSYVGGQFGTTAATTPAVSNFNYSLDTATVEMSFDTTFVDTSFPSAYDMNCVSSDLLSQGLGMSNIQYGEDVFQSSFGDGNNYQYSQENWMQPQ